ncbi:hypothetical protein Taro_037106 [Colocasia esculenta]|uniref:Uncharacterized protein n=1 Tax=Colocasia esculenta TaxID=4460 RepID=A0A843WFB1_COLES|nr:hypothetical protein [Colocasia esculenta]
MWTFVVELDGKRSGCRPIGSSNRRRGWVIPCRGFGCFGRSKCWIVEIRSSGSVRGCEEVFPSINWCTVRRFCPIGLTWRCSGFRGLRILTSTYVDIEIFNVDVNDEIYCR